MSRMTSKGQVTIPKKIRDYLGLQPGAEVDFTITNDGQIALRNKEHQKKHREGRFDEFVGTLDLGGMTTNEFMRLLRGDPSDDYG